MNDDDGNGQPIPADVAAAQREAEELESRQRRNSDDGNERQPDGGDRVPEVDAESMAAIRLRIEKLKADREEQSNKLRERVATKSLKFVTRQLVVTNVVVLGYVIFSFWFDHAVPSNVMVAWMASTFVEVIGILWVITRSLFPFNDAYRDRTGEKSKTKDC